MGRRPWTTRVWIVATLSCSIALLAVHEGVTRHAFDASIVAERLIEDTLPSLDRLAMLRSALRHVRSEARGVLQEPGRGRAHLDESLEVVRQELERYEETPCDPDEAGGRARLREAVGRLSPTTHDADHLAAMIRVADEADSDAARLIDTNTRHAHQAAHAVTAIHASATRLSLALMIAFACAMVVVGVVAERLIGRVEHEREARLRELDAFAARVAHDLKNPLSPCTLALGVLRAQRGLDDAGKRSVERAESGLRRAIELIDALLVFARAGGAPSPGDRCSVPEVCKSVAAMVAPIASQEFASLELALESDLEVNAKAPVLESMVANLVKNGFIYLAESSNRAVALRARGEGRWIEIEVEDHGPGIPPDVLRRLFRPFERGSTRPGGHGLGLATVKRLAEAHGGSVSVTSAVGSGTTFTIRLPRAASGSGRPVAVPAFDRA